MESDGVAVIQKTRPTYTPKIKWFNAFIITCFHILAVYGVWEAYAHFNVLTASWALFLGTISGIGVTGGAHRLWAHRAYKAKWPLKTLLLILYSIAGQNTVYDWVRDHRVHHKFSETDADPHNATRGFFFAHVGWLMQKKHPDVIKMGNQIDMSDIAGDPLIAFHTRYFVPIKLLFCFIIPISVPALCWNELWLRSFVLLGALRYVAGLNFTWSVNSAAHLWGLRPYDKSIYPAQNKVVSFLAMGEGWHNYHHVFPWDYKAAELGDSLNLTKAFIDFFAKIGWAYDLKTASAETIEQRSLRTGDGSHPYCHESIKNNNIY